MGVIDKIFYRISNWHLIARRENLKRHLKVCGPRVIIGNNVNVFSARQCEIGEGTSIGDNTVIYAYGNVTIGKNCWISSNCGISSLNHAFDKVSRREGKYEKCDPVVIGDDVWLGMNVVVLPGVSIGEGCIIGAGSVVTRSIEANSIAVGNPAKVIRKNIQ